MKSWKSYTIVLTGVALLSSGLWDAPASAKPKKERGTQTTNVAPASGSSMTSTTSTTSLTQTTNTQSVTLTSSQRTTLSNLLHGSNPTLVSQTTLTQIVGQRNSLPPGIKKQLQRGKGLPPGIAKKIPLSRQAVTSLNLPANYDLYIIGTNAVLYNTATRLIADCILDIL